MPRIIVLDNLSQDGLDLLESAGNIEYEVHTGLKGQQLREALSKFDGAICRSGVKITADVLQGNRRLKAIARAGAHRDRVDRPLVRNVGNRDTTDSSGYQVEVARIDTIDIFTESHREIDG